MLKRIFDWFKSFCDCVPTLAGATNDIPDDVVVTVVNSADICYSKIWTDHPAYIAGDRLRAWINLVGKSCCVYVYVTNTVENKTYYVTEGGLITEERAPFLANWVGGVSINVQVMNLLLPELPTGYWSFTVEMTEGERIVDFHVHDFLICFTTEACLVACKQDNDTLRRTLANWFVDPDLPLTAIGESYISYEDTMAMLKAALHHGENDVKIYLSDSKFRVPRERFLKYILALNKISDRAYVATTYDCDDFAAETTGFFNTVKLAELSAGLIWDFEHAFNVVIMERTDGVRVVKFLEPQNDRLYDPEERIAAGHKPRFVVM